MLSAGFGSEIADRLRFWVLYVYDTDDNPWEAYHGFFSIWASRVRREKHDSLGLSLDATAVAWEYQKTYRN